MKYEMKSPVLSFLGHLYNMTELKNIGPEDTVLEEISRKSNATVNFRIAVRNKSKDTYVYQLYAFNYWDNLTMTPHQMKYDGWKYLIYNSTSNCVKAIEESRDRGVQEDCATRDWKDPRLSHWSKHEEKKFDAKRPVVKRAFLHNYIYCYSYNITINGKQYQCPTYPFKLPVTTPFTTFGHSHSPITIKLSGKGPKFRMIDTTLPSLLMPEQPTTELQLLQSISKLKESAESLLFEREATITINRHEALWWLLATFAVIMSPATGFLLWNCVNRYKVLSTERFRKHMYRSVRRQSTAAEKNADLDSDGRKEIETSLGPSETDGTEQ